MPLSSTAAKFAGTKVASIVKDIAINAGTTAIASAYQKYSSSFFQSQTNDDENISDNKTQDTPNTDNTTPTPSLDFGF